MRVTFAVKKLVIGDPYDDWRNIRGGDVVLMVEVDFTSQEEARRNDDRPETQQWAGQLREIVQDEPAYQDLRQVCSTYESS